MRGQDMRMGSIFSYVDIEERVPASHPLCKIREFVNAALIQILLSVRSERQFMEQMLYNLLLRWFVGLGIDGL